MSSLCNMALPMDINMVMDEDIVVDALDPTFNATSILSGAANILQEKEIFESDILLSIDQAILQSIERCCKTLAFDKKCCVILIPSYFSRGVKEKDVFVYFDCWRRHEICRHQYLAAKQNYSSYSIYL